MKENIRDIFEGMGAVVAFMFMTALVWAMVGFYGVSEGSTDLWTESFKMAAEAVFNYFLK